ncbi:MAG: hypothetical protein HY871_05620, partial [Chloroflexi bacterium]|nr:hypothetical protein [Chloroflexota bacterium]
SDAAKLKVLRKLILYWDGQWFLKVVDRYGLEEAIALNSRVRTSFGRIEMRTMLQTLGKEKAEGLENALRIVATYGQVLVGTRVKSEYFTRGRQARVTVNACAAYEGARSAGLSRADQACVACETLWQAWLETLLPGRAITVDYPLRLGKGDARCEFVITAAE